MENKGKTWSRGTNSRPPFGVNVNLNLSTVTFTRDSGGLARNEFLVIREGYHILIFFIVGHCTAMGYFRS